MTTLHTLLFADQDASLWGVYWLPAAGGSAPLACRSGEVTDVLTAELDVTDTGGAWQLAGGGVSLAFRPTGPPAHGTPSDGKLKSLDQLCSVSGRLELPGEALEVDCLGWRARLEGEFDLAEIETLRQTYGWFDPADGVGLLALRPRKSRAHDSDLVAAAVLEPEPAPPVVEPRLSSTYDTAGLPTRVGLELWFEGGEPGEPEPDDERRHFPRRAAGEAAADPVEWQAGEFTMCAVPFLWHSRGDDGPGVYLLGKRR